MPPAVHPRGKKKHFQTTNAQQLAMVRWLENEQNFSMITGMMGGKPGFPMMDMAVAAASSSSRKVTGTGVFACSSSRTAKELNAMQMQMQMPMPMAMTSPKKSFTKAEGYRQMRAHINSQTAADWTVDMTRSRYESYLIMYKKARKILKAMEARLSPAEFQREAKKNDLCPYYDRMDALYGDDSSRLHALAAGRGRGGRGAGATGATGAGGHVNVLGGPALSAAAAAKTAAALAAMNSAFSTTSSSLGNSQDDDDDDDDDDDVDVDVDVDDVDDDELDEIETGDDSSSTSEASPHRFVPGMHDKAMNPALGMMAAAMAGFGDHHPLGKLHQQQQQQPPPAAAPVPRPWSSQSMKPGKKRDRGHNLIRASVPKAPLGGTPRLTTTAGAIGAGDARMRKHARKAGLLLDHPAMASSSSPLHPSGHQALAPTRKQVEWELYLQTNHRLGLYQQELEIVKQELLLKTLELKSREFLSKQEVRAGLIESLVKAGRSVDETKEFLALI